MRKGGTDHTVSEQNQALNSDSLVPKSMCLIAGPYVCGTGKGMGGWGDYLIRLHPTALPTVCLMQFYKVKQLQPEWVAIPLSRGSSQPRDRTQVSHIAGGFFTS